MFTVPAVRPVNVPSAATVPLAVLLLLQAPPVVASVRLAVVPTHTGTAPVITVIGLIVTITVPWQPPVVVYVINAVPPLKPVTTPVVDPTDAVASRVLHVPPVTLLCR